MKIMVRSIIIAFVACVFVNLLSFSATCDSIREKVLRLHVVANSDSKEDQTLKLAVRDKVLEKGADVFAGADSKEQVLEDARSALEVLEQAAQQEVYDRGYNYPVKAEICNMYFTTRDYGDITLPAGRYDAVRITIGSGQGQNWWCVMFPPLCVPSSCEKRQLDDVLTGAERKVVKGGTKYKLKFKLVEVFQSVFSR